MIERNITTLSRRKFDRYQVDLPGVATFENKSTPVRVLDLSLGGARVEMPLHASAYDMTALSVLRVAHVLHLRVRWRWSRDRQVGLQFLAPQLARDAIRHQLGISDFRSGG